MGTERVSELNFSLSADGRNSVTQVEQKPKNTDLQQSHEQVPDVAARVALDVGDEVAFVH